MNKQTVLEKASFAVSNADAKLAELTTLETKAADLDKEIAPYTQDEQAIIQSDKSDESKTKKLIEARTRREVKESNLANLRAKSRQRPRRQLLSGFTLTNFCVLCVMLWWPLAPIRY